MHIPISVGCAVVSALSPGVLSMPTIFGPSTTPTCQPHILYIDSNYGSGWAMYKFLPTWDFQLRNPRNCSQLKNSCGKITEHFSCWVFFVDFGLSIQQFHDLRNDYPHASEGVKIKAQMLSTRELAIVRHSNRTRKRWNLKLKKLMKKSTYTCHNLLFKF